MITIISPAKTLDFSENAQQGSSDSRLLDDSFRLVDNLKKKNSKKIQALMSVSKNIADLNVQRYQDFEKEFTESNSKAALFAFKGDVYLGLDVLSLEAKDIEYAQDHLRILSGLYGLLRPLDKMQPYRLEMGTRLKTTRGKNLYEFWKSRITNLLNKDMEEIDAKYLVNLASNEYFKAIQEEKLNAQLININFKEERDGKLSFISFNAKKARGLMARYIIQNQIENPEYLKGFDVDGYYYSEQHSEENNLLFIR